MAVHPRKIGEANQSASQSRVEAAGEGQNTRVWVDAAPSCRRVAKFSHLTLTGAAVVAKGVSDGGKGQKVVFFGVSAGARAAKAFAKVIFVFTDAASLFTKVIFEFTDVAS